MAKRIHRIELRHLRYFIAATDHGSFRKAAKALRIQESTISRAIRDLEDVIGASLFHRRVGGVSLTVAGGHFLERARTGLQRIDDGIRGVSAIARGKSGQINVGIFSSLASGFLLDLLRAYEKDHADVQISLSNGNPSEHVAAVRSLQLDVAFITGTRLWADCEAEVLWSEKVFVVLPHDHELAEKPELRWCDLEKQNFIVSEAAPGPEIHNYLVQRLSDLGHHPDINAYKLDRHNLLSLVSVGYGLTLTSEATTASNVPGVVYRPIINELLPFCAVWSSRNDNPALRRLLSIARTLSIGIVS